MHRIGLLRKFLWALLVPILLVMVGTAGFRFLEGLPPFEALYLAVITLTTIGFGDLVPHSMGGRIFTMILALGGIFTLFYAATAVIRAIVSGEVQGLLGKEYMDRSLAELHDHMIICGYGRMGRLVCQEFAKLGLPFVVIDRQADLLADFRLPRGLALPGDATLDEVLKRAQLQRARALVTVVASDADNLYITMTARLLNERLVIVARAEDERAVEKMERAGANRVISPYVIGGHRVAQAVLRPNVMDFIELATRTEHLDLQMEETAVKAGSALAGANLRDGKLRQDLGVIIVAVKKKQGKMVFNPPPEFVMEAGDILIALGHRQQLDQLEKLAGGA
jgi:voltage-gated potassium channel